MDRHHQPHRDCGRESAEYLKAFRPGGAKHVDAVALPQLAPDAPWAMDQLSYVLVVRPRAAPEVPGHPRSTWPQLGPATLKSRRDRDCARQALPRIDARPGVRLGEEYRGCSRRSNYPSVATPPGAPRNSTPGREGTYP